MKTKFNNLIISGNVIDDFLISNRLLFHFSGLTSKNTNGYFEGFERFYFESEEQLISMKWSKSLIKQLLLYLSLCDDRGEVGIVDVESISTLFNCSVRTLDNNNKILASTNFIKVDSLYGDLAHIKLMEHYKRYLDFNETVNSSPTDNTEFNEIVLEEQLITSNTVIKKDTLLKLLKLKNINALRASCLLIALCHIEMKINRKDKAIITHSMLREVLPQDYSKPKLKQLLKSVSNIFDLKVLEGKELTHFLNSYPKDELDSVLSKMNRSDSFLLVVRLMEN